MVADLARALKTVVTTGKAKFGLEETRRAIASGTARLVVVAENCPDKELLAGPLKVRRIIYPGDNLALGAACGKPFAISCLAVLDPGSSDIMSAQ
jgi:large subunit ribosomal protein L30e